MANFSNDVTDVNTQIAPSAAVLQPIDRANEIAGLQTIGQGVARGAAVLGSVFASQRASAKDKTLSTYSTELLDIQEAFEQGQISPAVAGTRRRALQKQYLANSPSLEQDILSRTSTFLEQSGLKEVKSPAMLETLKRQDQIERLVTDGWITPAQSRDEGIVSQAAANQQQFAQSVRELDMNSKKLGVEKDKLSLGSAQRTEKEAQIKQETLTQFAKIGRDAIPYWKTQFQSLQEQISSPNLPEAERQRLMSDGLVKIQNDYDQRKAALASASIGTVAQSDIDMVLKPQEDLIKAYTDGITGKTSLDVMNTRLEANQAVQKLMAYEGLTDEAKKWLAASSLTGNPMVLQGKLSVAITDSFTKNSKAGRGEGKPSDPITSNEVETKEVKAYLGAVKNTIDQRAKGRFDYMSPEEQTKVDVEIKEQMDAILKGVDVYSNSETSAKEFITVIDFFADPTIAAYARENKLNPETQGRVRRVMLDGYSAEIVPMLRENLQETYAKSMKDVLPTSESAKGLTATMGELIEPNFSGGRFSFKLKEGVENTPVNAAALRSINSGALPKVLNKTMAAQANLFNNGDVDSLWEDVWKPALFEATDTIGFDIPDAEEVIKDPESGEQSSLNIDDFDDEETFWIEPAQGEDISQPQESLRASAESSESFSSIVQAGKGYTTVQLPDGSTVRRTGTRAWRNHNPGNIEYGPFAKAQGAIGTDGRFAVFPSYEAGRKAKAALIFESKGYRDKSITQAINRYAPPFENNTSAYTNAVANAAGVPSSTKMSDLTPRQREAVLNAMERVEGFKTGKEVKMASK
jgi:hypothetical protein